MLPFAIILPVVGGYLVILSPVVNTLGGGGDLRVLLISMAIYKRQVNEPLNSLGTNTATERCRRWRSPSSRECSSHPGFGVSQEVFNG